MPDRRGRSAEQREAARLERERLRAARDGEPIPAAVPGRPHPAPLRFDGTGTEARGGSAPADSEPGASATGEHDGYPTGEHDGYPTGEHDAAYDTGEHAPELPSGTRRISRRETARMARDQRKAPKAKRVKTRRPHSRRRLWIGRIASVIALVLAGGLIWFLIQLFQPLKGSPHGHLTVVVPAKSSSKEIGNLLEHDGVIDSAFFFELRATLAGERGDLRSGRYRFQLGMSYGAVLTALTKAPPVAKTTQVTITEGRTRHAISTLLRRQHIKGDYLAATRSSKLIDLRAFGIRRRPSSLEGFLFPDTYSLVDPVKVSKLVSDQLTDFKHRFATVGLGYARGKHLTPYDVLKIASLVEGEAATAHDRPLVASVIYNRLADGMMLQMDSTTRYATGNLTRPLTVSQLHSRSPYNTRTHLGLPPTPIDNPGLASIRAAAHPARTGYLFFFAKPCSRGSVFATNYSQFLNLGHRYAKSHC